MLCEATTFPVVGCAWGKRFRVERYGSLLQVATSARELAENEFLSETSAHSFRRTNREIAKYHPDPSI
jgi:hypothetical protein